jgi:hypothetical protein
LKLFREPAETGVQFVFKFLVCPLLHGLLGSAHLGVLQREANKRLK